MIVNTLFRPALRLTLGLVLLAGMGLATGHTKPNKSPTQSYRNNPQAQQLAESLAQQLTAEGQDPAWVRKALLHSQRLPEVIRLVSPPPQGTPKNWAVYRTRFIEPRRIEAGVKFWRTHAAALSRAEAATGVPAEVVVGVIGVESIYGQHTGTFRVLDVLMTLSLDFPDIHPRKAERVTFFKKELTELLLLKRHGVDPLRLKGSYAGAMGWPQFMPSSWNRFAVDFDGDGRIDLLNSPVDAIGSVANYFKAFGWQTGMPTHYSVTFDPATLDLEALMLPDILPTFSVASLKVKGALPGPEGHIHKGPLALIELQNGTAPPSYVLGTENFYAITRYNWSSYYAMAVIELAAAVAASIKNEINYP
jgi:membrane-bound lytic murein transglycosylase B